MFRVAFAVVFAVAMLGATLPAVEAGATERTAAGVEVDLDRLERAMLALYDGEAATAPGVDGAVRRVTLRLPRDSWTTVPVASVDLVPTHTGARLSYRLRDGERVSRHVPVPLRTSLALEAPGRHRVVLRLVRDGDVAVAAERGERP
jgi:hypothetical protein